MKTSLSTGPGFYAAKTHASDPSVPVGSVRLFTVRIEAYDSPMKIGHFDPSDFMLLTEISDGHPEIARALILLGRAIETNLPRLKKQAGYDGG